MRLSTTRPFPLWATFCAMFGISIIALGCSSSGKAAKQRPAGGQDVKASRHGTRAHPRVMGTPTPTPAPVEFRGMFVTTAYNKDWPSRPGLHVNVQRNEMRAVVMR